MERVQVLHVDIAKPISSARTETRACLIIFWWGDCPVGQIETVGPALRLLDFSSLVADAVMPDVAARARAIVDAQASTATAPGPCASVVICTRDRPDQLQRCLASLRQQTLQPSQILVVDNAPRDDRTKETALAAGVDYVLEERPGLDIARNTGARHATGDVVVYTDDDVDLHPRWVERMVAAFERPEIMAVTGLVLPAELETEAQHHFETYWHFGRGYRPIEFGPKFFRSDRFYGCPVWEIGAGASMAFRREIFHKAGFFDERLDVGAAGCSGDSEYWHRVLTHGGVCRYEPSAVVFHYHRRDFQGLTKQIFYYMRGHAAALLVQYERSGNLGNLRRALASTPWWFAVRAAKRIAGRGTGHELFLFREMAGYLSGLVYYLRQPRPGRALPSTPKVGAASPR